MRLIKLSTQPRTSPPRSLATGTPQTSFRRPGFEADPASARAIRRLGSRLLRRTHLLRRRQGWCIARRRNKQATARRQPRRHLARRLVGNWCGDGTLRRRHLDHRGGDGLGRHVDRHGSRRHFIRSGRDRSGRDRCGRDRHGRDRGCCCGGSSHRRDTGLRRDLVDHDRARRLAMLDRALLKRWRPKVQIAAMMAPIPAAVAAMTPAAAVTTMACVGGSREQPESENHDGGTGHGHGAGSSWSGWWGAAHHWSPV